MEPLESGLDLFDKHITGEALSGLGMAMLFNLQLLAIGEYRRVGVHLDIDRHEPPFAYRGRAYFNSAVYRKLR